MNQQWPDRTLDPDVVDQHPLADDRNVGQRRLSRVGRWLSARGLAPDPREAFDQHIAACGRRVSRTNHIAFASPKGGVGKTTCTLLVGDQLASIAHLRCLAIDIDPAGGTLGSLPSEDLRRQRSLPDLLRDLDRLDTVAAVRPYVSVMPGGLHVLGAPSGILTPDEIGAEDCRRLLHQLGRFYEVLLLDLGPGVTGPLARMALERSDHVVLIATPELVTIERVVVALEDLAAVTEPERMTLLLNQTPRRDGRDIQLLHDILDQADVRQRLDLPYDPELRAALDTGVYHIDDVHPTTRQAITQLASSVAETLE